MTTHLDRFSSKQRDALSLLREAIRRFAMLEFDAIHTPDPQALARGLYEARTIVASDPEVLREAGRQMFTQFNLAPYDQRKRNAVLSAYHDDAQLAQWTVVALNWIGHLAAAMEARTPPTMH